MEIYLYPFLFLVLYAHMSEYSGCTLERRAPALKIKFIHCERSARIWNGQIYLYSFMRSTEC